MPPVRCEWSTIHKIIHNVLQLQKHCYQWVPQILTNNMTRSTGVSLNFLTLYYKHDEDLLDQAMAITGDKMWVHYYTPPTKRVSIRWKKVGASKGESENKKAC